MTKKVFPLQSRIVFSPAVIRRVPEEELMDAFSRHSSEDWGVASIELSTRNQHSLTAGGEIISEFVSRSGVRFRLTTTSDSHYTEFETV